LQMCKDACTVVGVSWCCNVLLCTYCSKCIVVL